MKTKSIKYLSAFASLAMVFAVLLSSLHAKEVVAAAPSRPKRTQISTNDIQLVRQADDPLAKSLSDLHSHTDKTMLKNFIKAVSDGPTLVADRRQIGVPLGSDQSLKTRFIEIVLMIKLACAYALAR